MNTTTLFHGSPETITEIHGEGLFGGLFASANCAAAKSHGATLHVIESPRHLTDFALNYEVEGAYDVALELVDGDEATADAIMSKRCEALDDSDGEQGWEFQRLRGELARRLGYTSVEMEDEHGTTYLCLPGCTIRLATDDDC